jgi:hypothetical protein
MTDLTTRRTRPRRWRSRPWLPAVAVVSLASLVAPQSAAAHPPLHPAAVGVSADAKQWTERPPLQESRFAHDVAMVDGRIFVVGGVNSNDKIIGSVESRRRSGNGRWETVAPMPTARANAAAAALDGAVYVAGGIVPVGSGFDLVDVVERFDPRTGRWTTVTKLPDKRGLAGAAGLGNLLYVAGGFVGDEPDASRTVVAYDPRTGGWRSVAPMSTARARFRLVAAGGHLYAIGGVSSDTGDPGDIPASVERYDPGSDTWTTVASMKRGRKLPGVVAINQGPRHLIVVIGGETPEIGRLRTTEVYDVNTGQWHLLRALLPSATVSLVAATEADGTVLAVGGNAINFDEPTATDKVFALKVADHNS